MRKKVRFVVAFTMLASLLSCGEKQQTMVNSDGHQLWFYSLGDTPTLTTGKSTMEILQSEINNYWRGEQTVNVKLLRRANSSLGRDGYVISYSTDSVVIYSNNEVAALYATYDLLRMQECGELGRKAFNKTEIPSYQYRLLNHWDNPDGTIERGYAGHSLWKWEELPQTIRPEYIEYARANASVGINGAVLNNVNASPSILTEEYLQRVKVLADIFRPYGIKVFLSLNFASPKHLANLSTSDPLDHDVIEWWRAKVKQIYGIIPDFGGFLVKANSEGQSGPQDYGRTHVDGANMIADAIAPYGGIVMWRAFVYDAKSPDRAMQASEEFMPLDGQFRDNVLIQIKNGPVDFQPREPFSPLFGQLKSTQSVVEVQITQEYLGHSNHLVYLHPMWKECLDSETYMTSEGSTVSDITEGRVIPYRYTAIAGVSNIGDDVNWCGHHFAQANWYAYGRMAWNSSLSSEQIATEWIKQTFNDSPKLIKPVLAMMMGSREANVRYEMPLGLHHIFKGSDHYGPGPWDRAPRPDWEPQYYHKAAADGIGFNRTMSGTGAVAQYNEPLSSLYNNVESCPENLLLWFHHLPWDYKMKSGRSLWDELCYTYESGIKEARSYIDVWNGVKGYVDEERFNHVAARIERQAKDAIWWRDACMLYFQRYSGMDIPKDCTPPQHTIEELISFRMGITNYENPQLDRLPEYILK